MADVKTQPLSPQSPVGSPVSRSSTSASRSSVALNRASPQVISNEHHAHNCCNGRYHCDGSKCPQGPLLNPAIGIPLAICTAGLSQAAIGMYKGVRDHRSRKKMQAAWREEQARQDNLDAAETTVRQAVKPSPVALESESSLKAVEAGRGGASAEIDGTPADTKTAAAPGPKAKAELDGEALPAPPVYAAELDSREVKILEKSAD